jgi:preprotein translocase subunit SecE
MNDESRTGADGRRNRGKDMTTEVAERDENERKRTGPVTFFKEVRAEGRKVTWATRQETTVSTIFVLIMVIAAALFFFTVDTILRTAVSFILSLAS